MLIRRRGILNRMAKDCKKKKGKEKMMKLVMTPSAVMCRFYAFLCVSLRGWMDVCILTVSQTYLTRTRCAVSHMSPMIYRDNKVGL